MDINNNLDALRAYTTCEVETDWEPTDDPTEIKVTKTEKMAIRVPFKRDDATWMPISNTRILSSRDEKYYLFGGMDRSVGVYGALCFDTVRNINQFADDWSKTSYGRLLYFLNVISCVAVLQRYIYPLPIKRKELRRYTAMRLLLEDVINFVNLDMNCQGSEMLDISDFIPKRVDCNFDLPIKFAVKKFNNSQMNKIVAFIGARGTEVFVTVNTNNGMQTYCLDIKGLASVYEETVAGFKGIEDYAIRTEIYSAVTEYILIYLGYYIPHCTSAVMCSYENDQDLQLYPISDFDSQDSQTVSYLKMMSVLDWSIKDSSRT